MTKDQLQKELLKKVKEGVKPSDLKKNKEKNPATSTPPATPQTKPELKEHILEKHNPYKEKSQQLEQKNKQLIEKLTRLEKQDKNTTNNQSEQLFNCYHCHQDQPVPLLVLELPEGKLCQTCWKLLRNKTKQIIQSPKFTCHNCRENNEGTEYKVKLGASLLDHSICSLCLPLVKEYNEAESKADRELDIWE